MNNQCPGCGSTQIAAFDTAPPNGKVTFLGAMIILEDSPQLAERLSVPPARDYATPIYMMGGIGLITLLIAIGGEHFPEFTLPPVIGINGLKNTSWSLLGLASLIAFFLGFIIFLNVVERKDYMKSVKTFSGRRCCKCHLQWRS